MGKKVIVIGAGLGGLSAACRLAKARFSVTILEKNEIIGGKVNLVEANGYKFDTGASLLTMPHILRELFEFTGRRIEDYLELMLLEPICRYFWPDGTRFEASQDLQKTIREIEKLAPRDAANFHKFLADSKQKYEIAERTFLAAGLGDLLKLARPRHLRDLFKIASLKTLDQHNRRYFSSPKMQQIFNRFATYNGSSPFEAPATFALIPYVEFGLGAWYTRGGMYEIPRCVGRLAGELGVVIETGAEVEQIIVKNGKAVGVKVGGKEREADFVVANSDAVETYRNLIDKEARRGFSDRKLKSREPSSSGFVLLLGARRKFDCLAHHNIFFSEDYRAEFDAIFKAGRPPADPTIYVCAVTRTDPTQAPEGHENLFVLVNAPYVSEKTDWAQEAQNYRDLIIGKLENFGLEDLRASIDFEQILTPADFEKKYRANRGSIYGISSNGLLSAFMRIPNKAPDIENLYFAGGAAHPGGGIPLVLLSGKMAAGEITKDELRPL